jgi:hypothetical protein
LQTTSNKLELEVIRTTSCWPPLPLLHMKVTYKHVRFVKLKN